MRCRCRAVFFPGPARVFTKTIASELSSCATLNEILSHTKNHTQATYLSKGTAVAMRRAQALESLEHRLGERRRLGSLRLDALAQRV